ncbi:MAG: SusC/RagA family TonB-linked outer membrane protein [Chryseobacterium sp.]|jgi:TonB-linked SusC/RagA family outer membrane protein|uniref:SusC/RagA family TonB-linked outer membrane protein n=1 Tax=Chryseobacterium sp. TaxID=1871047 RepID=UPI00282ACC21|nr:SusC/RagA family TonB-linked outer membrane protein [Chryseobacterium sp.]MDR2236292.1 SusC/RagA family TonB-linked outer membrane protein [Chryseobacterium sp.]
MNVKLRVLSVGALFFINGMYNAQKTKVDTAQSKEIEEVVVLGYNRTYTKPKDVSANTTVSAEVMENRPNVSFLNSLQGSAPGVTIASNSGSPGSAKIDLVIRGISSLSADTEPLVIIDGVPTGANQFRNLNAEDIETVSVLRDAAATSIYGNRGANGVLLVKTKGGKFNSKLKLSYSTMTGVSIMPKNKYNMADAHQLLRIQKNNGVLLGNTLTDDQINNYPINTDWEKTFFKADVTQQHNISATFGGENTSVYSSIGYLEQGGLVPNTKFQRFTFRNNITGRSEDKRFNYTAIIGLGYSKRRQLNQETNSGINGNIVQNPLLGSFMSLPYLQSGQYGSGQQLYDAIGNASSANGNFAYVLEDVLRGDQSVFGRFNETSIFTSATTSYKLTDDITINNRTGADIKMGNSFAGRHPNGYLSIVVARNAGIEYGGSETIGNSRELNFTTVSSVNYNKVFGDHTIGLGAYMEYNKVHFYSSAQVQNGLDPKNFVIGTGVGYIPFDPDKDIYVPSVGANKITAGALSYFATADYDYADKYGFSGTLRRDGNYRFAPGNKWGTFWSVGGRWNIDKENFMEGSVFDMLKLRASYGTQGNANVIAAGDDTNPMLLATGISREVNIVGNGYGNTPGYFLNNIANPTVQWEEIKQANIGLDFKLFKKLEGNVDVYRKSTDMLYYNIPSSAITGQYNFRGNYGGLKNEGVEVVLRYNILSNNDYKLTLFANASYNENKITKLLIPVSTGSLLLEEGGTINEWNLVPYLGVNPNNGNELYLDSNGNVSEQALEKDRRKTGKNYFPKYTGGFGLNAEYKGFFLDALFSFQAKFWRSDNQLTWALNPSYMRSGNNVSADLLNAWTPDNRETDIPSLNAPMSSITDRLLYDASYLRLKNITLGYNVPKRFFNEKSVVKAARIFLQGENIMTWTKWRGYDPEGLGTFPLSVYPNPRTFSIGANLDF